MLDFFRLFKDGKRYHRIMEGFQRIFAATIFFGSDNEPEGKLVLDWARFHFFDRLHLWFHRDQAAPLSAPMMETSSFSVSHSTRKSTRTAFRSSGRWWLPSPTHQGYSIFTYSSCGRLGRWTGFQFTSPYSPPVDSLTNWALGNTLPTVSFGANSAIGFLR